MKVNFSEVILTLLFINKVYMRFLLMVLKYKLTILVPF